jgi:hypothetical protein
MNAGETGSGSGSEATGWLYCTVLASSYYSHEKHVPYLSNGGLQIFLVRIPQSCW